MSLTICLACANVSGTRISQYTSCSWATFKVAAEDPALSITTYRSLPLNCLQYAFTVALNVFLSLLLPLKASNHMGKADL